MWRGIFITVGLTAAGYLGFLAWLVGAYVQFAFGHSFYDPDCCGGHDCEPVQAVTYQPAPAKAGVAGGPNTLPVMVVTTSLGTKPVTPETKFRESRDSRMHACIFQGRLICLYLPPGT